MDEGLIGGLAAEIAGLAALCPVGRVAAVAGGRIELAGLGRHVALGDRVRIATAGGALMAEVAGLGPERAVALAEGAAAGVRIGDRAEPRGPVRIAPHDSWIGRVIDPQGAPLDGRPLGRGPAPRALLAPPPPPAARRGFGARLSTGLAVFDTLLPIVQGQRLGLFAGSGVGKSTLLGDLARGLSCDVAVIALVGERGRELRTFVEEVLGPRGLSRSVIVTATSDRPAPERRRAALAAMTVAEHFRDAGAQVLLLVDSVTRFAEAHREVALAAGEPMGPGGFPPSLGQAVMALAERAGPGAGAAGDITAVFTVLVAGSDMEEPVADLLRGVLDGHVVLDRGIAERGRFPAVDLLRSVSRSLPGAADPEENALIAAARRQLGLYDRFEAMIRAGLHMPGADPALDEAIRVFPLLDAFLAEPSAGVAEAFARLAGCLAPAPRTGGGAGAQPGAAAPPAAMPAAPAFSLDAGA